MKQNSKRGDSDHALSNKSEKNLLAQNLLAQNSIKSEMTARIRKE